MDRVLFGMNLATCKLVSCTSWLLKVEREGMTIWLQDVCCGSYPASLEGSSSLLSPQETIMWPCYLNELSTCFQPSIFRQVGWAVCSRKTIIWIPSGLMLLCIPCNGITWKRQISSIQYHQRWYPCKCWQLRQLLYNRTCHSWLGNPINTNWCEPLKISMQGDLKLVISPVFFKIYMKT